MISDLEDLKRCSKEEILDASCSLVDKLQQDKIAKDYGLSTVGCKNCNDKDLEFLELKFLMVEFAMNHKSCENLKSSCNPCELDGCNSISECIAPIVFEPIIE